MRTNHRVTTQYTMMLQQPSNAAIIRARTGQFAPTTAIVTLVHVDMDIPDSTVTSVCVIFLRQQYIIESKHDKVFINKQIYVTLFMGVLKANNTKVQFCHVPSRVRIVFITMIRSDINAHTLLL